MAFGREIGRSSRSCSPQPQSANLRQTVQSGGAKPGGECSANCALEQRWKPGPNILWREADGLWEDSGALENSPDGSDIIIGQSCRLRSPKCSGRGIS